MTDSIFQVDQLQEAIDLEAKRAAGRDGKGALPSDVWETYSAFANTVGGTILLGVSENGGRLEVTGIEEPERVLEEFWSEVNKPHKVSMNLMTTDSVELFSTGEGRWVIVMHVPRAEQKDRPVYIGGNPLTGTYKREEASDVRCSEEEVRNMLNQKTRG